MTVKTLTTWTCDYCGDTASSEVWVSKPLDWATIIPPALGMFEYHACWNCAERLKLREVRSEKHAGKLSNTKSE